MKKLGLIVLVVAALAVVACGPQMATPTPGGEGTSEGSSASDMAPVKTATVAASEDGAPAAKPSDDEPLADAGSGDETASPEPASGSQLPVDDDDWHVLGSPDAPVTIFEYSDFQ